jgi:hypothetical protein
MAVVPFRFRERYTILNVGNQTKSKLIGRCSLCDVSRQEFLAVTGELEWEYG